MRISDWSSDVCSSDLEIAVPAAHCIGTRHHHGPVIGMDAGQPGLAGDRGAVVRAAPQFVHPRIKGGFVGVEVVGPDADEIGRASCRERVCQYVYISVVAVALKKKKER